MGAGCFLGWKFYSNEKLNLGRGKIQSRLELDSHSGFTIYDIPGNSGGFRFVERLKIRGITSQMVTISTANEARGLAALGKLRERGAVQGSRVDFPIVASAKGEAWTAKEFDQTLKGIPITNLEQKGGPYVVVYGINNCPHTNRAMESLRAKSISFEYADLNANPANPGRAMAHLIDSGYSESKFDTPVIEVNGYARPRLSIQEVETRLGN